MTRTTWGSRYAIVASTLALLLALGGTAHAVNTVRSADIVDGAVKTADLGTGAVQSIDIKNNTITPADVAPSSLGRSPRIWAHVSGTGELTVGSGVVGAERSSLGTYNVTLNQSAESCAVSVTPTSSPVLTLADKNDAVVTVFVRDLEDSQVDASFDLIVVC